MPEAVTTAEENPSDKASERVSPWSALLCIVAAFSTVWFTRFGFPASNNVYHVPIVLGYAGSVEGPHDAFHRSLAHFTSYFWPMVAAIATEQNIRTVFLILLIVATVLTVLAAYRLAVVAGASRAVAAAGCGILAFAFGSRQFMEYGNGELLSGFVTHSQFATALCLFAFSLGVRRHWLVASLACGVAADINLFLAFWTMTNLLLMCAVVNWRLHGRVPMGMCAGMSCICLAMASPAIIWAMQSLGSSTALEFSFTEFLYLYEPHHSFTHIQVGPFANFFLLAFSLWFCFRKYVHSPQGAALLDLLATALTLVMIGAVVAYLSDSKVLQNLYPLRYAAMVHWICAVVAVVVWADACKRDHGNALFGAIAVLGFMLSAPTVTLLGLLFLLPRASAVTRGELLLLFGIAISSLVPTFFGMRAHTIDLTRIGPVPIVTLVSISATALIAMGNDFGWKRRALLTALICIATVASPLAGQAISIPLSLLIVTATAAIRIGNDRIAATSLIASLIVIAAYAIRGNNGLVIVGTIVIVTVAFLLSRFAVHLRLNGSVTTMRAGVILLSALGFSQAVSRDFDFPRWSLWDSWSDVQMWARHHTAPDTLFYAPDRGDFATLSRRPVWWDDIQGAAVMWDSSFYTEWNSRRLLAEKARTMDDIVALAHREKIKFLVLGRKRVQEISAGVADIRYCNQDFCIVEMQPHSS